jgi:hypothetical protein
MRRTCLLLALTCCFCFGSKGQEPAPIRVSLVQLIAAPDKFDAKVVAVWGFLVMDREGDLLYLGQPDADNGLLENSIWIRRTEEMGKQKELLNRKYVKVVGTYRQNFYEQLGDPRGGIPEVRAVTLWSDPSYPMSEKIKELLGVTK